MRQETECYAVNTHHGAITASNQSIADIYLSHVRKSWKNSVFGENSC
jgi:hypothetical protein